ncbi:unnamed protein product [Protopolystoma xenopodis]|uniref:Uncharacterized protein n=1 Tax=Protopolystoma xenopodis TaxID=117903 RepID=A0A3S5B611_9PLAT|nr:unnamed protein product [Protopolystoma xenopodis]
MRQEGHTQVRIRTTARSRMAEAEGPSDWEARSHLEYSLQIVLFGGDLHRDRRYGGCRYCDAPSFSRLFSLLTEKRKTGSLKEILVGPIISRRREA